MMNIYKKCLCTLWAVLLGTLLFAEQNWREEDNFSSEGDGFKYEQIFSTRNVKTITEAQIVALFNQKMNGYLKTSSQYAYEWMVYDESYKQQNIKERDYVYLLILKKLYGIAFSL